MNTFYFIFAFLPQAHTTATPTYYIHALFGKLWPSLILPTRHILCIHNSMVSLIFRLHTFKMLWLQYLWLHFYCIRFLWTLLYYIRNSSMIIRFLSPGLRCELISIIKQEDSKPIVVNVTKSRENCTSILHFNTTVKGRRKVYSHWICQYLALYCVWSAVSHLSFIDDIKLWKRHKKS